MLIKKISLSLLLASFAVVIFTGCINEKNSDAMINNTKVVTESVNEPTKVNISKKTVVTSPYEGKWGRVKERISGSAAYYGTKKEIDFIDVRKAKVEERNDKNRNEYIVKFGSAYYHQLKNYREIEKRVLEITYRWIMLPNHSNKIIGVEDKNSVMHLLQANNGGGQRLCYTPNEKTIKYVAEARRKDGFPDLVYNRLTDEDITDIKNTIRNDITNSKFISDQREQLKKQGYILEIKFID